MRRSIFDRRIPTLLALLLLIGGIGTASYLVNTTLKLTSQASPDEKPQNIRITNITDKSFTVTYITSKAVLGTVTFGTTKPSQTALDDRDKKSASPKEFTTHAITIDGLQKKTSYVFSITSGVNTFLDNGTPFHITTPEELSEKPTGKTITGSILSQNGEKISNVLVYVSTDKGQVLSSLSNQNGEYTLPLSGMRSKNLDSYLTLSEDTKMNLIALLSTTTSQVSFLLIDPSIPQITLSQNYDFTLGRTILLPESSSDSANVSFPVLTGNPVEDTPVTLDTPKNDEQFSDVQPKFSGTGTPSEVVAITIKSTEQTATVTTDTNGSWSYRPTTPLDPGEHTITIKTHDKNGILRQITRSFIVLAQGSQFTEPSVSPAQSPAPSVSPTHEPSLTPTQIPTPTIIPSETLVPSLVPTGEVIEFPTTALSPTITPRPSMQPTGSTTFTTVGVISFAFMTLGVILLLFTRKISL